MVRRNTSVLITIMFLVILTGQLGKAQEPLREIIINIPAFRLYLYENGVRIREYPIGVGNLVKPSIMGETRIINRVVNPTYYPTRWWERGLEPILPGPDNPVGTRWLGLGFPGYGIHGTNNPNSIGEALSSGCIRMHNADVEELTNLVTIGTPVYLLYETMTLETDPLLGTRLITIYPDVYRLGLNSTDYAKQLFTRLSWSDVHLPVLEYLVTSKHTGRSQILPIAITCMVNGTPLSKQAVKFGKTYYVPLEAIVGSADNYKFYQDWKHWDVVYVNLVELANAHGMGYQISDQIDLFNIELFLADQLLNVPTFVLDNKLHLPVEVLSDELGLPAGEHLADVTTRIGNKNYISYEDCSRWGFTVAWEYPDRRGELLIPQAYLDGISLGVAFRGASNEMYVQLNSVMDLMEIHLEWFDTHGVEAMEVGDLLYVPEWVIRWLMPGADLSIVFPEQA